MACPSRGTTLMSARLDSCVNVLLNLLGWLPSMRGKPWYEAFRAFVTGFVGAHANLDDVPGLAAMDPEGSFIAWLNSLHAADALTNLTGDASGNDGLRRLAALLMDRFFPGSNDLVVDTDAMMGGALRATAPARLHFQASPSSEIWHLGYFRNPEVRGSIDAWTAGDGPAAGETSFRGTVEYLADLAGGAGLKPPTMTGRRPRVILVPGIMGLPVRPCSRRRAGSP